MKKLYPTIVCAVLSTCFLAAQAQDNPVSEEGWSKAQTEQSAPENSSAAGEPGSSDKSLSKRPRIGLALGGGGSRGAAHVGVLKVLKEENIPIDMIAGTSIGSVVGGFYAAGKPIDEIAEIFHKNKFTKEFTPMPGLRLATEPAELMLRLVGYKPYDGLYYGWKFRKYVSKLLNNKQIEELSIPYAAVVTDVVTGKSSRLTSGDIALAMQASTAVPGLKKPVQVGDKLYCDGGLINNVPVNHVREMGADFVIAVDIDEKLKDQPLDKFKGLGSMARQALRIQLATLDELSDQKADCYIHPDTTGIALVSFKKGSGEHGLEAGEAAARKAIPEIKKKLAALGVSLEQPGTLSSTGEPQ
ncbi:MAG: patatin-like phospholipase family protein [Cyanobacteria bacterium HKST-UBA02]|nr:patatin-like phospholipase family protein [Cyanobacteria bacterium HKST-UBA02]